METEVTRWRREIQCSMSYPRQQVNKQHASVSIGIQQLSAPPCIFLKTESPDAPFKTVSATGMLGESFEKKKLEPT